MLLASCLATFCAFNTASGLRSWLAFVYSDPACGTVKAALFERVCKGIGAAANELQRNVRGVWQKRSGGREGRRGLVYIMNQSQYSMRPCCMFALSGLHLPRPSFGGVHAACIHPLVQSYN